MDPNRESGFRIISTGTVVYDKKPGDPTIQVRLDEHRTLSNGPIRHDNLTFKGSLVNKEGIAIESTLVAGETVLATWRAFGSTNQITSPDVVSGEAVIVFGFADTQDYYWDKHGNEPGLRRLEHVVQSYSNKPSGRDAYDANSSYWMLWSTRDKKVQVHTSTNNGEPAGYDISLDTEHGIVTIQDDLGNSIVLDSQNGKLTGTVKEEITLTTKRLVFNAEESVTITTKTMTTSTKTAELNADNSTINAETHLENAAVTITQGLSATNTGGGPAGVLKGDFQMEGQLTVNGNIEASGTIMDGGGNSNHHSH